MLLRRLQGSASLNLDFPTVYPPRYMYTVGNTTIYRGERFPTVYSTPRYINRKHVPHGIYPRYDSCPRYITHGISLPTVYVPHGVCSPLDTPTVYNLHPRYMHVPTVYSQCIRFARVNIYRGGNLYTVDVKTFTPWVTDRYTVGTVFFIYRGGYTVGNRFFLYRGRYTVGNRFLYTVGNSFYIPWSICRGEQICIYRGEHVVLSKVYTVSPHGI